jgi:hypothetical protein
MDRIGKNEQNSGLSPNNENPFEPAARARHIPCMKTNTK